jgi:hypothetical protein
MMRLNGASMSEKLHEPLFVAARHQLVVEILELSLTHIREHFSRQLRIRRGAAGL